jgi:hypothetical protein
MLKRSNTACGANCRRSVTGSTKLQALPRRAETCAAAGNLPKALEIALDIDQLLYEATTLLNAAALMARLRDD